MVDDFRRALPEATVYVYDNNSSDDTSAIAAAHGAVVRFEPRQGKGNVVRQMFRDIEADCYLMVDGDDTYPAEAARGLCEPILSGKADMTVGDRLSNGTYAEENKRAFHGFGNNLVRAMIKWIYGYGFEDVMTGYRAFSPRVCKDVPRSPPKGFQIETELSIHAVDRRWRIQDVPIVYRDRPAGSESKLSTVSDGIRVIMMIGHALQGLPPLEVLQPHRALVLHRGARIRHTRHRGVLPDRSCRALPHRHPRGSAHVPVRPFARYRLHPRQPRQGGTVASGSSPSTAKQTPPALRNPGKDIETDV